MSRARGPLGRIDSIRLASGLVVVVLTDFVTMFLARVRPENRKDFQETFFPDGDSRGSLPGLPQDLRVSPW